MLNKEEKDNLMNSLQAESARLKKEMSKLSYRIPRFFKKLWYNLTTKKPHPPYHECKDIKYIEIQFENCEVANIPREALNNFWLANIKLNIHICANAVIEDKEAETVWMVIDKEYTDNHYSSFADYFEDKKPNITDRLTNYNDITHIYINYNDGTEDCYSCVWAGDSEYNNEAQIVTIEDKDRCVCIDIKRREK